MSTNSRQVAAVNDQPKAGQSVVVDAVHRELAERTLLREGAARAGVGFFGIWLDAQEDVLIERVSHRTADASDADADVVRRQVEEPLGEIEWHRLDASRPLEAVAADARRVIRDETA